MKSNRKDKLRKTNNPNESETMGSYVQTSQLDIGSSQITLADLENSDFEQYTGPLTNVHLFSPPEQSRFEFAEDIEKNNLSIGRNSRLNKNKVNVQELVDNGKGFTFTLECKGKYRNKVQRFYVVCYEGAYRRSTQHSDDNLEDYSRRLLWVNSGNPVYESQISLDGVKEALGLAPPDSNGQLFCYQSNIAKREIAVSQIDRNHILEARSEKESQLQKLKKSSQPIIINFSPNMFFSANQGRMPMPAATSVINSPQSESPKQFREIKLIQPAPLRSINPINPRQLFEPTQNTSSEEFVSPGLKRKRKDGSE